MKKAFNLLTLTAALLISGCNVKPASGSNTVIPSVDSTSESQQGTSQNPTSNTPTPHPTSATSQSTQDSSSSSDVSPVAQTITIAEAIAKCNAAKTSHSEEKEFNTEEEVVIKGNLFQDITIYTSNEHITLFADETGTIGLRHSPSWNVDDGWIAKEDSNYYVYGKIGYWFSQPVLYMTSNPSYESSLTIDVNYRDFDYEQQTSIEAFNDYCASMDYNKKGHGYGKFVSMGPIKCIAKADNNSWLFSDGEFVQGIYHQSSNTAFTVGKYYKIYGISSVYKWKPSIRCLVYDLDNEANFEVDIAAHAVEKTATQMYMYSWNDTDKEKSTVTDNFVKTFKYFYKVTDQYVNYYTSNANYYIVSGNTYYSSYVSSETTASDRRMISFNNDSCIRLQDQSDFNRIPVRDYIGVERSVDLYTCQYQFTKSNGRFVPHVYLFEDYVPRLSFPDIELKDFFSGQPYLFNEYHLYFPDSETAIECVYTIGESSLSNFNVIASNVSAEEFAAVKAEMDNWERIVFKSDLSTETHFVYQHTQATPKFRQGIQYNESAQELVFDFVRINNN